VAAILSAAVFPQLLRACCPYHATLQQSLLLLLLVV
jgi:hypothetical protein